AEFYLDLMSHDLTNFNQTILGNLNLLERRAATDEKMDRYIKACLRQLGKSENLIGKVRAFSQIKHIGLEAFKPIDLDKMITEAIGMVTGLYPTRLVEASFESAGGRLAMGTELLDSVFMNVIENAVKHSAEDPVVIRVSADAAPGGFWNIRIEDEGQGVPDEMKDKIFDRFTRIGHEKGMGLGLSLTRAIIEKFGGSIRVEDRVPGESTKGSVFIINIPRAD
ncbi:MAG TPA: HAMP domain-containing sensor histidine kinase, partial [bacterium]|nr:HAMP domain-containing sensor histidine kinase [bacterium]